MKSDRYVIEIIRKVIRMIKMICVIKIMTTNNSNISKNDISTCK